jgi:hypothetical protein
MSSSDIIRTVGSGVTILVGVITLVWFIANLDGRVKRLEEQIHTLTIAPTIATNGDPTKPPTSPSEVKNPIAETCANLAIQAAQSIKAGHDITEAGPIRDLMKSLGCLVK